MGCSGAKYAEHWSFVVPRRSEAPRVKQAGWPKNDIDRFILARLEAAGLAPAPEADKTTLIRRATLDLTGLPPTLGEIDAFLADNTTDAYEKLIDRLLVSPHHGERLALDWLDAARYADTHGYHIDSGRDMTRWREWVIDSFNLIKPFDELTIEQLAGDLLPEATLDQKVASGFNRNHMINFEGGAVPDEYHTAYIIDRVNTTGAVWLGLTVGCAQCHDHKYDPITQRDFYRLFAFFYNVPENGLDGSKGNAVPLLKAPDADQQKKLDELSAGIQKIEQQLAAAWPEVDAAQPAWEKSALAANAVEWTAFDPVEFRSQGGATLKKLDDKSLLVSGTNPAVETYTVVARTDRKNITAFRLEVLPDASFMANGPGRSVNGNIVLTNVTLALRRRRNRQPPPNPCVSKPRRQTSASRTFRWPMPLMPIRKPDGQSIRKWANRTPPSSSWKIRLPATPSHCSPSRSNSSRSSLSISAGNSGLPSPVPRTHTLPWDFQRRSYKFWHRLRRSATIHSAANCERTSAPRLLPRGGDSRNSWPRLRKSQAELDKLIPTAMIMQEMATPRDTFMLIRGQYDKKGEKVTAGVPEHIAPFSKDAPAQSPGIGPLADRPCTATDLARDRQSLLADVFWNRPGQDGRGFRLTR